MTKSLSHSLIIVNNTCFIQILKCRWQSILHHVCNEHEWTEDDGQTNRCGHHPLTAQEQSKRQWMKRESSAFENLESLVNDKRLLKDLEQMALFKHTGEFIIVLLISLNTLQNHSVMIMFSFSYSFPFLFYCIQARWRSFTVQCSSTSVPKRQGFSFQGMRERGHLACLEHNENIVKRKQATTKTGV